MVTPVALRYTSAPALAAISTPGSIQPRTPDFLSGAFDLNEIRSRLQVLRHIGKHQLLDVGDRYGLAIRELDHCLAIVGMKRRDIM